MQKVTAGKSAYYTHHDFSAAKLEKKSAQITRVNAVYKATLLYIAHYSQSTLHVFAISCNTYVICSTQ
jgi:hypothetical protein